MLELLNQYGQDPDWDESIDGWFSYVVHDGHLVVQFEKYNDTGEPNDVFTYRWALTPVDG